MKDEGLKRVKAFAPATIGNVSCGFDVFGLAVESPGDEVILTISDEPGVIIKKISGDEGRLPFEVEKNTAGFAVKKFLEKTGNEVGVELELIKKMPLGSGMGSSAASAAAALCAVNKLTGAKFSKRELLPIAANAEKVACGSAHADNVAPSLLGGFTLIRSYNPLDVIKIPVPDFLWTVIVHPDVTVRTEDARDLLPKTIPLTLAVKQWGNIAAFTASLFMKDRDLLSRAMEDFVAEPLRKKLIPGFDNLKRVALESGALGCGISGSGPSVFVFTDSKDIAEICEKEITLLFAARGVESDSYISKVNNDGAKILEASDEIF